MSKTSKIILVVFVALAGVIVVAAKKSPLVPAKVTATGGVPTPILTGTAIPSTVVVPTVTEGPPTEISPTVVEPTLTITPIVPTATTGAAIAPYPEAPLCADHDTEHNHSLWHSLWDSVRGCHYNHEHGQNPYTPQVAAAFPGMNLLELNCFFQVGGCNPSSPIENLTKHGGFKWQVSINVPQGCAVGFEGGTVAIDAYAIQIHSFGLQSVELEARNHSSVSLLRQCKSGNPSDKGYIFVGQLQEYGQRTMPYQGMVLPYPDNFMPVYDSARGPYFTTECVGNDITLDGKFIDCRPVGDVTSNNLTVWTSKRTGPASSPRPLVPTLFGLLYRGRDAYQRLDINDLVYPFTWPFVCGGNVYNPVGCRYNNSSITIHEIRGVIPTAWDNLAGFDTDQRVGRITATAFVTRYGTLAPTCTLPVGLDCQTAKLVQAFVGTYSSEISINKVSNPTPIDTPERDIYFCGGVMCGETSPGAVPSGWIGPSN